jgi:SNF family Na+-dependent transporter
MTLSLNIKKLSAVLVSFSLLFVIGIISVYAQQGGGTNPPQGGGTNPPQGGGTNIPVNITLTNPFSKADSLFELLETVVNDILLPIGGVLAVLAFIYSGFKYVTAQGNEDKIKTAHKALLYTSIGTAVLLGSWVIAQLIENTINQLK